ncbi:hypothetical protein [Paenibacillus woosongensis]|uniref:Uncharacterized protein n=1 Tax=Paenibacillus woosongensis TaxID=307580 RepID=A0A7X3CR91_9BACL|nr:hypothetical protein [Paenibacillus woosongensis]MUG47925.1 hypothetical protein [Paenibacillus woosongensis]
MDYFSPMDEVNILAKLADLKEDHYHQLLALSAMMELLIEKGVLSREEIAQKTSELDCSKARPPYPTA